MPLPAAAARGPHLGRHDAAKGQRKLNISPLLGAAGAGVGGVIYASQILSIVPDQFNLNISILILACVVFGGIGNIWGVILGAVLLSFTPERIRFLSQPRILVFGIALVVMMNLRPDGILPKKKREHFDPNWDKVEESGEGAIK